jgi:hypothetical protein
MPADEPAGAADQGGFHRCVSPRGLPSDGGKGPCRDCTIAI